MATGYLVQWGSIGTVGKLIEGDKHRRRKSRRLVTQGKIIYEYEITPRVLAKLLKNGKLVALGHEHRDLGEGKVGSEEKLRATKDPVRHKLKFDLDPEQLNDKSFQDLKMMIRERDPDAALPKDKETAIKILSHDRPKE